MRGLRGNWVRTGQYKVLRYCMPFLFQSCSYGHFFRKLTARPSMTIHFGSRVFRSRVVESVPPTDPGLPPDPSSMVRCGNVPRIKGSAPQPKHNLAIGTMPRRLNTLMYVPAAGA